MAKTFKVNSTLYRVSAMVCYTDNSGMHVSNYSGEGFTTKNVVKVKKLIRDSFVNDGCKVLGIDNIVITPFDNSSIIKFDVSTLDIIQALIDAGFAPIYD